MKTPESKTETQKIDNLVWDQLSKRGKPSHRYILPLLKFLFRPSLPTAFFTTAISISTAERSELSQPWKNFHSIPLAKNIFDLNQLQHLKSNQNWIAFALNQEFSASLDRLHKVILNFTITLFLYPISFLLSSQKNILLTFQFK